MKKEPFGNNALLYTLENRNGLKLKLTDIGASITGIFFKDNNSKEIEIAFGSDDPAFYNSANAHMGATVGRVAGRTIGGEFYIDGKKYELSKNKGSDHTHGGFKGLSYVIFQSAINAKKETEESITFSYLSKDKEEGYPGNLEVKATYTLNDKNEIIIEYTAKTDKATPVNIMNHAYFNLNGKGKIYGHEIFIDAPFYLPAGGNGITSGEILKTKNTLYDFTTSKLLGELIEKTGGYDNCFIFETSDINKKTARVYSKDTGIFLDLYTTMPSVLFYTANSLKNLQVRNQKLNGHEAFCLETQYFSCSLNYNHFPSIILMPDREFRHKTIYKVGII